MTGRSIKGMEEQAAVVFDQLVQVQARPWADGGRVRLPFVGIRQGADRGSQFDRLMRLLLKSEHP